MATAVYILCALTRLLCAVLLLVAYTRVKKPLLLWSGICFAGLTVSNLLVVLDLVILPHVDLFLWRLAAAVIAMAFLLYGLIWEER